MLRNLVIQLSKDGNLGASNQMVLEYSRQGEIREEDMVQNLFEVMEIGE
jgi:hypothetical protein